MDRQVVSVSVSVVIYITLCDFFLILKLITACLFL